MPWRTSAALNIHRAADFAAGEIRDDRFARINRNRRLRFIRARAQMRREHDILKSKKRMILGRRFGLIDVNGSAGDFLFLQRICQSEFIDDFAARIVHDQ